jgi:hypothetical protein
MNEKILSVSPTRKTVLNTKEVVEKKQDKNIMIICVSISISLLIAIIVICKTFYDINERELFYRLELEKFHITETKKYHNYYLYNDK